MIKIIFIWYTSTLIQLSSIIDILIDYYFFDGTGIWEICNPLVNHLIKGTQTNEHQCEAENLMIISQMQINQ